MARGRPPEPAGIVAGLAGSAGARQRLDLMLQTLTGKASIPEAAGQLGLGRSRFCLLRRQALQAAVDALEPQARGRPPTQSTPEEQEIAMLQEQVQALKIDLKAAQIREKLALLMPHVLHRNQGRRKKNAAAGPNRPAGGRRHSGAAARPTPRPHAAGDRSGDAG